LKLIAVRRMSNIRVMPSSIQKVDAGHSVIVPRAQPRSNCIICSSFGDLIQCHGYIMLKTDYILDLCIYGSIFVDSTSAAFT